ncbi:MAG: hypothetical protein M0024_07505 [Nitrospiraceae bacterium]|nr:hypothetical protein [Nitrospiraceae bacterium]
MKRVAGVSLGQSSLGGCVADIRFRSLKPAGFEEAPLPAEAAARRDAIAAFLGRWKKERDPRGLVVGLPLQSISHHVVDLPAMDRSDMRRALSFELEKYLPLDVNEYYFDFVPMRAEKGRTQAAVFAVKKETVDAVVTLAREAGLELLAVRPSFLAALRGLSELQGGKSLNGIFVHGAEDAYELAGLRKSVPVYLKSVPRDGNVGETVERLSAQYPGAVYFDGPDEAVLGARVPVTKVHPRIPHILAFSAVKRGPLDINLLPAGDTVRQWHYFPRASAAIGAAAISVYLLTGLMIYYKDSSALTEIETRRTAIRSRASGLLEAKKKLDALDSSRRVLSEFRGRSTVAVGALAGLSEILPKEAWLISLTVDEKGKIEMEGFAARSSSVVMALEKSHLFRDIAYSAPIITKDGEERFALKMEMAGPGE